MRFALFSVGVNWNAYLFLARELFKMLLKSGKNVAIAVAVEIP